MEGQCVQKYATASVEMPNTSFQTKLSNLIFKDSVKCHKLTKEIGGMRFDWPIPKPVLYEGEGDMIFF